MRDGKKARQAEAARICRRLGIDDPRFVEIEAKRRVKPEKFAALREHLIGRKGVKHKKTAFFFDQFLDTPSMDLFRRGASLRLRYKRNGSHVYLQYKGPGFHRKGLLYRSEFSTGRLTRVLLEESHHDIVHFTDVTVRDIVRRDVPAPMRDAMNRHLGPRALDRISVGPIISLYQKEKFAVDLGPAFLEPSLDRIFAFHIAKSGLHPLSTFCEYENEVKSDEESLPEKIRHVPALEEFDRKLEKKFDLRREPLDKYHRCASFFVKKK